MKGFSARNRLTDARDAVYRLLTAPPMRKRIAVADSHSELCCIQGRLEKLVEDLPAVIHIEPGDMGNPIILEKSIGFGYLAVRITPS